jgi:hypothetical protein
MALQASGHEHLQAAQALFERAVTADELRTAQAVLLPLVLGLSMAQTALAIGRSPSATCAMRMRFCRVAAGLAAPPLKKTDLRNRAHVSLGGERRLLAKVCGRARHTGPDLIARLQQEMELAIGRPVALSSVYRLLRRHGWRRLMPDQDAAPTLPHGAPERRARAKPRWAKV